MDLVGLALSMREEPFHPCTFCDKYVTHDFVEDSTSLVYIIVLSYAKYGRLAIHVCNLYAGTWSVNLWGKYQQLQNLELELNCMVRLDKSLLQPVRSLDYLSMVLVFFF